MTTAEQGEIVRESDALHARVQAFQTASLSGDRTEPFDDLALAIARFQARHVAPVRRLVEARGIDLATATTANVIPAVPTDVFRLARVGAHPPELDAVVFRTSGTTRGAGVRGEHPFRRTDTYEHGAIRIASLVLFPPKAPCAVVALAPSPSEMPDSSLSFMIDRFGAALEGGCTWHVHVGGRGARAGRVDAEGVRRAVETARGHGQTVLIAGTSFAFVHMADEMGDAHLQAPPLSRAMITGGFKGQSREVDPRELRALVGRTFGLDPSRDVTSEYGMTELSSQLYDAAGDGAGPPGSFRAPPWLRVVAVDPLTLEPVREGDVGIARFVDLANVDSAVAVQTADRLRVASRGVELLGRLPGATPRGCALAMDEILGG